MKHTFTAFLALPLLLASSLSFAEELPQVTYPMSEVRTLHATANNKDYDLFIQLPQSYKETNADESGKNSMLTDAQTFEKSLRSHNYINLKLQVEVLKNENHHSVFPALLSKGLMKSIPLNP